MRATMASSLAFSATLSPWFVAARNARLRAGASQIVAYHAVLLPLWVNARPPAQVRCQTSQPPAYSKPAGGVWSARNVTALSRRGLPRAAAMWSAANRAQSGIEQCTVPAGPKEGALSIGVGGAWAPAPPGPPGWAAAPGCPPPPP